MFCDEREKKLTCYIAFCCPFFLFKTAGYIIHAQQWGDMAQEVRAVGSAQGSGLLVRSYPRHVKVSLSKTPNP